MRLFRTRNLGFGSAGIARQRICGALTYLGAATALQRGIELAETGVGAISFDVEYFPEINEKHQNNLGQTDGKVVATLSSRKITLEAEVTGTTGVMLHTFITAITGLTNDVADFGSPTGGIYMDRVTIRQRRADWRAGTWEYSSDPLLA